MNKNIKIIRNQRPLRQNVLRQLRAPISNRPTAPPVVLAVPPPPIYKATLESNKFGAWLDDSLLKFRQPVSIFYNIPESTPEPGAINVLCNFMEPLALRDHHDVIIKNHTKFDLILTCSPKVLSSCFNATKMIYGTTWVAPEAWGLNNNKIFKTSTLVGAKNSLPGHKIRHQIWDQYHKFNIPAEWWASHNWSPKLGPKFNKLEKSQNAKIDMLKDTQFHIAIENSIEENYFTEKLIDCFMTKTIPIYYGCPNIQNYFDPGGIIMANSSGEIIEKCNSLTADIYNSMLPSVNSNYEQGLYYAQKLEIRMVETIESILHI